MKQGEETLNNVSEKSRNALVKYEAHIKSMDENFMLATESLRREVAAQSGEASSKVKTMVSDAMESILTILDSSQGTRKELGSILLNLQDTSLKTSEEVGHRALEQHSKMESALGIFNDGMKKHDELQVELADQLSVVSDYGKSQLEELAGQEVALSKQKQAFTDAKQEQSRMQSDIITTVMQGVQELLSREMKRLNQETETRFNVFATDNDEILNLNASIKSTTQNIE